MRTLMYEDSAFATVTRETVDWAPHNRGITPIFFVESVIDPAASEKAGRAIYRDMERVRIQIAGDSFSAAVHPVDEGIINRFEEAYAKWKRKGHVAINGTPLAKWPLATPSFIREMEFLNIFSVDDLASVADVHLDRIADGRQWRDRAAAWLQSAADGAAAARYAAENARLREDVERLSLRLDEMAAGRAGGVPLKPAKARPGKLYAVMERKAAKARKPMSAERRAEIGARLKAARETAKAARETVAIQRITEG
jgi:hypothetical protein